MKKENIRKALKLDVKEFMDFLDEILSKEEADDFKLFFGIKI